MCVWACHQRTHLRQISDKSVQKDQTCIWLQHLDMPRCFVDKSMSGLSLVLDKSVQWSLTTAKSILLALDSGNLVMLTFLDLSATFDSVDHDTYWSGCIPRWEPSSDIWNRHSPPPAFHWHSHTGCFIYWSFYAWRSSLPSSFSTCMEKPSAFC